MACGFFMLEVKGPFGADLPDDVWCIISAKSPRGIDHAVVGKRYEIVHDPYPEGGGVAEEERTYIFFVLIEPKYGSICT